MSGLRKRVLLKSPVRKIRTPGSVRGLSGNWQSYRNGCSLVKDSMTIKQRYPRKVDDKHDRLEVRECWATL